MIQDSVIQISLGSAIGAIAVLLVGLGAVVFGFGKLLLVQIERRMNERNRVVEEKLEVEAGRISRLADEVNKLNTNLPLEYVRREDWIRFSASIEAKLDRLAEIVIRCLSSQGGK